jgi:hypothetical protein
MKKIICFDIEKCKDCMWKRKVRCFTNGNSIYHYKKVCAKMDEKTIENTETIPDWCPLENGKNEN